MTIDTSRETVQRLADQECNVLDALSMAFALLDRAERAEAERDALKAERDALEAFRSQIANLMLTGDDMGDGTEFEAADHADQHECLEGLIVKARALGDAS